MENGGFETAMMVDEDQEFSFRLAQKGYKLKFVPAVYHRHVRQFSALREAEIHHRLLENTTVALASRKGVWRFAHATGPTAANPAGRSLLGQPGGWAGVAPGHVGRRRIGDGISAHHAAVSGVGCADRLAGAGAGLPAAAGGAHPGPGGRAAGRHRQRALPAAS